MHRSRPLIAQPALLTAALPLLALTWQPAMGASECKGLAQDVCVTNENCRWMDGYTRKDGIQVSSHCRLSKPRKKDAAEIQAKADTPVDTKPETVTAEVKPETVTADVKPETMKADAKPETVAADVKPEAATTDTPTETATTTN
ncbi:hypothetical protein HW932_09980 [Allochromatium humboldtianum]|uniref:Uncharacterized protein n=1 Tax=Allochromatium humboldtianum TaxID=504901 RepID=A0A850R4H3_9GAMM|nr:hypothetical protein [Allochromatium humboldtianum]NVZ09589.1 hypothetical protein [Allochromatium humboldtianum]